MVDNKTHYTIHKKAHSLLFAQKSILSNEIALPILSPIQNSTYGKRSAPQSKYLIIHNNMLHNISTRVYARASTVFRFLHSPLHPARIKN